jgi:hypothetical protein
MNGKTFEIKGNALLSSNNSFLDALKHAVLGGSWRGV